MRVNKPKGHLKLSRTGFLNEGTKLEIKIRRANKTAG